MSGLVAADAVRRAGLIPVIYERRDVFGGQWHDVYESVHLLSSKKASQFSDYPMPEEYPNFPSGDQFRDYVIGFAEHAGLAAFTRFGSEVLHAEPVEAGMRGWTLTLSDGSTDRVDALIVATGHLVDPYIPEEPGDFSGKQLHTSHYRRVEDLSGQRILVVGSGNSACDMAIDAVNARKQVTMSIRRPTWFVPPSLFGTPRGDLTFMRRWPGWASRAVSLAMIKISSGSPDRYGLPKPEHNDFTKVPPTISTLVPYWIQRGRIAIKPMISRFDGKTVKFSDGTSAEYDTIIWATGYKVQLPYFDEGLIHWINGIPSRKVGGLLSADVANLYFSGLTSPRGGSPKNYGIGARTLTALIQAQFELDAPLSTTVFADEPGTDRMDYLLPVWIEVLDRARKKLSGYLRRRAVPRAVERQTVGQR